MDEQEKILPQEEVDTHAEQPPVKSSWQQTKEGWYDKVPLTLKQLDIIIGCCIAGLILTAIAIALDAMGVF